MPGAAKRLTFCGKYVIQNTLRLLLVRVTLQKKFRGMKNQKSELLTIRLTADQKKAIREAAGKHGCTVSELVRSLAKTTVNKAA